VRPIIIHWLFLIGMTSAGEAWDSFKHLPSVIQFILIGLAVIAAHAEARPALVSRHHFREMK
jgi:hypothetical protein